MMSTVGKTEWEGAGVYILDWEFVKGEKIACWSRSKESRDRHPGDWRPTWKQKKNGRGA